jgi:hypothetical protein
MLTLAQKRATQKPVCVHLQMDFACGCVVWFAPCGQWPGLHWDDHPADGSGALKRKLGATQRIIAPVQEAGLDPTGCSNGRNGHKLENADSPLHEVDRDPTGCADGRNEHKPEHFIPNRALR